MITGGDFIPHKPIAKECEGTFVLLSGEVSTLKIKLKL